MPGSTSRRPLILRALLAAAFVFSVSSVSATSAAPAVPIASAAAPHFPAAPSATRPWWVFFSDRGANRLDAAWSARIAGEIPSASWARRARVGAACPDERDLPVWEPYVREIARLGRVRIRTRWFNGVSAELDETAVAAVRRLPFVREVRPVASARPAGIEPSDLFQVSPSQAGHPATAGPWPYGASYGQLAEIGVPPLHALGYTGNRVLMMMLDTGFMKDHHAFSHDRVFAEHDFVFHDSNTQNEQGDDPHAQDHGTATWGTAGGYAPGHLIGPGYGASFVLAKTEDIRSETRVEEDNYVAALEWADSLGVVVTSASLAYYCFDDGFCYYYPMKDGDTAVVTRACDVAAARGILCVNGIGNRGNQDESITTPADADSIVAVGAVDSLNQIADFSSHGPSDDGRTKPEVVARGVSTWCAYSSGPDDYGPNSGTSLSTPLVGGACALLLEAHPEWGPMDARAALMATADRTGHPDNYYGWGRINVQAALTWRPVVYPQPFSLLEPADGDTSLTLAPTFRWRASRDPDDFRSPVYTLHLREAPPGTQEWQIEAGTDTVLTLPFPLDPSSSFSWEVTAADLQAHVRTSRETYRLQTGGASGLAGPRPPADGPLVVSFGPNPSRGEIRFRVTLAGLGWSSGSIPTSQTGPALPSRAGSSLPAGSGPSSAGPALRWAVYDPLGRSIASGSARESYGRYEASWDGLGPGGARPPAGVYYLDLRVGAKAARRTLVRLPG